MENIVLCKENAIEFKIDKEQEVSIKFMKRFVRITAFYIDWQRMRDIPKISRK